MIAVGLIGYGLAGKTFHAPLIGAVERLRLAAVATSRAAAVAADWPSARVAPDAAALIADPAIELIVVATPNDTHAPLARAALAAGKHVVIDKPFALDVAEGEALIALAAAQERMLTVFHNRRWDGDFRTVRTLIGDGAVGTPMLYEARWDRFRLDQRAGWKDEAGRGAGLLADLGSHLIDQALQLFGVPDTLSADLAVQRAGGVTEDYVELTLHYGPMRAILSAAMTVAAARPRFALHGTGGSFVKYGLDPQEAALGGGLDPDSAGFGEDAVALFGTLTKPDGATRRITTERGAYRDFYEGVAKAIGDGAPPPVDPADAVAGLRLIELARRSAAEGRRLTVG
ncbi:oxidoreductase [Sphingomonas koreensis]|nr:oxidoreductase [Sphingomonas koreensis]